MNRNKNDKGCPSQGNTPHHMVADSSNQQQTNTVTAHKDYSQLSFEETYRLCRQLGAFD